MGLWIYEFLYFSKHFPHENENEALEKTDKERAWKKRARFSTEEFYVYKVIQLWKTSGKRSDNGDSFNKLEKPGKLSTPLKEQPLAQKRKIILASKSPSRALILEGAGVAFDIVTAAIDESETKREGLKKGLTPKEISQVLARQKAATVSKNNLERFVLGADQILECEGEMFDKPEDMIAARETLLKLRGKTHRLISCAAIYLGGSPVFEVVEEADLTMLDFSDEFLERYLTETGDKILTSVGAYQLEAEGAQLFDHINGEFFTVLGLPLVPVLGFLHGEGVLKD